MNAQQTSNMPDFLIIGAAKCGTTALHRYLSEHPQIYMSPTKELNFFALEGTDCSIYKGDISGRQSPNLINNLEEYKSFFEQALNEQIIGESSPLYMLHPSAAQNIKNHLPYAKLISILRNPVDRAYSDFLFNLGRGTEPITSFTEAIQAEPQRIRDQYWYRWHYKSRGFYFEQIQRYFKLFDSAQIKIILYEELQHNTSTVLKDIFRFLGVDPSFQPEYSRKHNVTYVPRSRLISQSLQSKNSVAHNLKNIIPKEIRRQFKQKIMSWNQQEFAELSLEIRQQLNKEYRNDIFQLQDLIQKDLSSWLLE